MLVSKYSAPEFNPYGDRAPDEPTGLWRAPSAGAPLRASVSLPGSKSLTNRELVLSALADGPSLLRAPLHSDDTAHMVDALRSLGARLDERPPSGAFGADWLVTPGELTGSTTIDCGQAGTVMRFVPPLAALALGPTTFDAADSARHRPMRTTIDSLRALGVDINDDGRKKLPFTVHGTGMVRGGNISIDASASSQFVSGLLLAAPRFESGLQLRHAGERLPSIPHIDMTIASLAGRGVEVLSSAPGEWSVPQAVIQGAEITIEPDLSNAAPFLIAALVTGGEVSVMGWPERTTQAGAQLIDILPQFGADVRYEHGRLTVLGSGSIDGVNLDLSEAGELAPALIALASLAAGPSEITGIGHIRHHETDRLAALVTEINGLGGAVTELEDGVHIEPRELSGGTWKTYDDHRMAMAGAIIGLAVGGIDIQDVGVTAKTLPEFTALWQELLTGTSA